MSLAAGIVRRYCDIVYMFYWSICIHIKRVCLCLWLCLCSTLYRLDKTLTLARWNYHEWLVLIKFVCVMKRVEKRKMKRSSSFRLLYYITRLLALSLCSAIFVPFSIVALLFHLPSFFFSRFWWWLFLLSCTLVFASVITLQSSIYMLAKKPSSVRKHTKNLHKFITLYVAELTLCMSWFNVNEQRVQYTHTYIHRYFMRSPF